MRFRLDHPVHTAVYAEYGHDRALGFFVTVRGKHGRRLDYDALHGDYAGLAGALAFLAKGGFFTLEDLYEALLHVEQESEEDLRSGLRPIALVVTNFKVAADPA
jgi:hypothetical protein